MPLSISRDASAVREPLAVASEATINAVLAKVSRLHVAAEIAAIDLGHLAFAANDATLHFLGHCLTQLVAQNERGLAGEAEIARKRQSGLSLDLVQEDRDGREIRAQRQRKRGAPFGRRQS